MSFNFLHHFSNDTDKRNDTSEFRKYRNRDRFFPPFYESKDAKQTEIHVYVVPTYSDFIEKGPKQGSNIT